MTWDWQLYFPSEGRRAEDFFALKIRRLRPGLNPQPCVLKASTLPLDHQSRLERHTCTHMHSHTHCCGMKSKVTLNLCDKKWCTMTALMSSSDLNLWTFITFLRGQTHESHIATRSITHIYQVISDYPCKEYKDINCPWVYEICASHSSTTKDTFLGTWWNRQVF